VRVWLVVLAVGTATIALKAAGPLLLARKPLGPRALAVVDLVAPVMLVALVVTQTVGGDRTLVVDARVAGVAAAGFVLWRGAPIVPAMVVAAVVTALLRALT
jgi:hypothetical protein